MSAPGPGRRLSDDEEERGAALYADGATTRAVARELAISRSSAQRLRVRLAEAGRLAPAVGDGDAADGDDGPADAIDAELAAMASGDTAAELAAVTGQREALAARLNAVAADHFAALADLEAAQLARAAVIEADGDPSAQRSAIHDARDRIEEAEAGAASLMAKIAEADERVAVAAARHAERLAADELAAAVAAAEVTCERAAAVMRESIAAYADLGPAGEFMNAVLDDAEAMARVAAAAAAAGVPVPDSPSGRLRVPAAHGAQGGYLLRAISAGLDRDPAAVHMALAGVAGWQPPDPQECAALDAETAAEAEAEAAARAAAKRAADERAFLAMAADVERLNALGQANRAHVAAAQPLPAEDVHIGRDGLPIRVPVSRQQPPWAPSPGTAYPSSYRTGW